MVSGDKIQSSKEETFDLTDLLLFLWQKKIRIVITASLLITLGMYYVLQQPKEYKATSLLLLGEGSPNLSLSTMAALSGGSDGKMDTHIEFIKSKQFILSVVEQLALHNEPIYYPAKGDNAGRPNIDHTVATVRANLSLSSVKNTEMLKVTFSSRNPKLAWQVVNQIGPSFFEFRSVRNRDKAINASRWLNTQIDEIQSALNQAEAKLEVFLQENELVDISSQIRLVQNEISTLMREKLLLEKQYVELRSTFEQLSEFKGDANGLLGVPWIMNNPLVSDLRRRISERDQALNEVSKRYKSKHLKHIAVKTSLDQLKVELDKLLKQLVTSFSKEYQAAVNRRNQLDTQIESARSEHNKFGRLEIEFTRLRREVESNQKLYEAFLSRLQEMEVLKDLGSQDNYAVVDYASMPTAPYKPRVLLSAVMVFMLSMVFSTGFWLILHLISDKKSRLNKLMRKLEVPILTEVPKLAQSRGKKNVSAVIKEGEKNYQFSEAIRTLRTSIIVRPDIDENRIIAVTGLEKGDGKSSLAISLAMSFGKLEKALLIDTDLRVPSIAKAFGLENDHPGITNFVGRKAKFSDCLYHEPHSQLAIMPSGPVPQDPTAYISKPRFANIIRKLGIFYERVIVEAPPITSYSDALILSKYVDSIVIVCDAENTDNTLLIESIQRLQDCNAPLLGVVFNKVKNVRSNLPGNSRTQRLIRKMFSWKRAT